jgi:hypothetical protein
MHPPLLRNPFNYNLSGAAGKYCVRTADRLATAPNPAP